MKHIQRKFAWIPDTPDFRDYKYKMRIPIRALPRKIDLRDKCSPVEDQGDLGSCTANALAGALEFNEIARSEPVFIDMSRLFIYYNERVIENTVEYDSGAMLRDGIKTLSKEGCCNEPLWPYDINKYDEKPTQDCYTDALSRVITSYYRIGTLNNMKECLAGGEPFVFGFAVYESFMSDKVFKTGVVNLPTRRERMLGGHAVLAVGYDDSSQRFIVKNSWGKDWGQEGYFTIPYKYLSNRNLADDMWYTKK